MIVIYLMAIIGTTITGTASFVAFIITITAAKTIAVVRAFTQS